MLTIPYARQDIAATDIRAVIAALRSDRLTQGKLTESFEKAVAEYCGAQYAVAVSSGTAALHLACMAADLGRGDSLWTSPNTFVASANCGLYCGATVDFVDIDPRAYNLSRSALEEKLAAAAVGGYLPKVVVAVDFAGQSCEMESLAALAEKYRFQLIEDASHALGGRYRGTKIGCGKYAALTVFSFHPVKIITTGEGGMVLTNDQALYQKLFYLRSHGIVREPSLMRGEPDGPWYYQQLDLGFNYRMTELQAALGLSQLERLPKFLERRRRLVERYNVGLRDLPLVLPWRQPDTESANHLYVVRLELSKLKKDRLRIYKELREKGIEVNVHYIPVHTQPYYRNLGFKTGDFPEAERYYAEALTLPLYYGLTEAEQDYVMATVRETLK